MIMNGFARFMAIAAALFTAALPLRAQFYGVGTDAGGLKWYSVETANYKVIYPAGTDSLARVMATRLEQARIPVGGTIGFVPNQFYRRKMPVVMHTRTGYNNGMVTWIPRRLEIFAVYDAYDPSPLNAYKELAVHESRHIAQMQFGRDTCFRAFNFLFGELASGAVSAVYGGPTFFEGDAVTAETALTGSGRGRTADFLEYIRASFDEGDFRNYWRWRFGSNRLFTPDQYRVGYISVAGMRAFYDAPDFSARFYKHIHDHHGWSIYPFEKTVRSISGKDFRSTFAAISDTLGRIWSAEADSRAPYTPACQLTATEKNFTAYTGTVYADGALYSVRSGMADAHTLVKIDRKGHVTRIGPFASSTSRLRYDPEGGRIWWSEYRRDPRWALQATSVIRYMGPDCKYRDFAAGSRLYNPAPHGTRLSATEYPEDGSSAIVVFDSGSGERLSSRRSPDGMQFVESAWAGDELYVSAIVDEGMGIWRLEGLEEVLPPQPVKIKQLTGQGGLLHFVSDRSGADEVYSLDPRDASLVQLTSSRIGSSEYAFGGDTLYVSRLRRDGRMIYASAVDSLRGTPVRWTDRHRYPMAEELSAGEPEPIVESPMQVSDPVRYSKLGHLVNVHSWLPVWADYDRLGSISFENITTSANLGATAFFQNVLGTFSGYAGVSLLDADAGFRPAAHLDFVWEGWYPVIEARLDVNDYERRGYQYLRLTKEDGSKYIKAKAFPIGGPSVSGSVSTYLPLHFNSGGWLRGVIPELSWSFSSDLLARAIVSVDSEDDVHGLLAPAGIRGRLTAGLRTYTMLPTADAAIYPRLGIGLNLGYTTRPGLTAFYGDKIYAHVYGYLPGFTPTQGLKAAVVAQRELGSPKFGEAYVSSLPRGFHSKAVSSLAVKYPTQVKVSLDYGIPFASVDWAGLSPWVYLRNFELIPHLDWTSLVRKDDACSLFSAGASLSAVLGNLIWIPYDTRVGVSCSWNFGDVFSKVGEKDAKHFYCGFLFSVDM